MTDKEPMPKPSDAPKADRLVEVKLLHDVWIEDANEPGGTRRIRTNTPVIDADGNWMVDPKSKQPITKIETVKLPVSIAQILVDQGKALSTATL